MATFTTTGSEQAHDIVHMVGKKDIYTITENNGTLTYIGPTHTYINSNIDIMGFKAPDSSGDDTFKYNHEIVLKTGIDDDFSEGIRDFYWTVVNTTGTITNPSNNIQMTSTISGSNHNLVSNFGLEGDFDVQVDISHLGGGGNVTGRIFDTVNNIQMNLHWNGSSHYTGTNTQIAPVSYSSGQIRLVRTGSTTGCYYRENSSVGWNLRENCPTGTEVAVISLELLSTSGTTSYTFDNFKLNSGIIIGI